MLIFFDKDLDIVFNFFDHSAININSCQMFGLISMVDRNVLDGNWNGEDAFIATDVKHCFGVEVIGKEHL
jgi:hypothetical protein